MINSLFTIAIGAFVGGVLMSQAANTVIQQSQCVNDAPTRAILGLGGVVIGASFIYSLARAAGMI